jgi:hypothetical protein
MYPPFDANWAFVKMCTQSGKRVNGQTETPFDNRACLNPKVGAGLFYAK